MSELKVRKLEGPAHSRPMCCATFEETSYATQRARHPRHQIGCQNRAQFEVNGKFYCRHHVPKNLGEPVTSKRTQIARDMHSRGTPKKSVDTWLAIIYAFEQMGYQVVRNDETAEYQGLRNARSD